MHLFILWKWKGQEVGTRGDISIVDISSLSASILGTHSTGSVSMSESVPWASEVTNSDSCEVSNPGQLRCLLNASKQTWAPGSPSIPQFLSVTVWWLPYSTPYSKAKTSPAQGLGCPSLHHQAILVTWPSVLSRTLLVHTFGPWLLFPFFPLSPLMAQLSWLVATLNFPRSPCLRQCFPSDLQLTLSSTIPRKSHVLYF